MQVLGEESGRARIEQFRTCIPSKVSKGWHDAGVSIPGTKNRLRNRAPTPDAAALSAILAVGTSRSLLDGAIAGLGCFSGLELDEISELRWRDVKWQDQSGAPFCEVKVLRSGHRTTCFVMAEGAKALLSYALVSGLQRDAFVFPGRRQGEALSRGAIRDRLRAICRGAGWPGLTRSQLTSAFVLWLRANDLDDHSIRLALGRRRAATVDRLSRNSNSIAAQTFMDTALEQLR
jgi:integrase